MNQKKNDGGPAFPVPGLQNDADFNGMTLRDHFAARALGALFSIEANPRIGTEVQPYDWSDAARRAYAEQAYHLAEAMLAARAATPTTE